MSTKGRNQINKNKKVVTLKDNEKVHEWIKKKTGLKRTTGIKNEIIPEPVFNEIVSAWVERAKNMKFEPTINFYINEKLCNQISTDFRNNLESTTSNNAFQMTANENFNQYNVNAELMIPTINLVQINNSQKILKQQLNDLCKKLKNEINEFKQDKLEKRQEKCNFKLADYVKYLNTILIGSDNINDFHKQLETEKKEAKSKLGIESE